MAKYNISYDKNMVISISKGNGKTGDEVHIFNTLPGEHPLTLKDGTVLTDIIGTCKGCCDGCEDLCYAVGYTKRHHNTVIPAAAKNTLMVRNDLEGTFEQIQLYCKLKHPKYFRFHSSGEIESYEYLLKMVELAEACPEVQYYFYTKRFAWVEKYLKEHGKFPKNLVCNISEWEDNTNGYDLPGLNRFVYDDGTHPEYESLIHCPAVAKGGYHTGITCSQCGRCARNHGKKVAVYAHK